MANNIVSINSQQTGTSPFDAIRRFDENGNECWYGRELMPFLGYAKWQRFEGAIERAMVSCANSNHKVGDHFMHLPGSVSGSGRTGDNYKLSRHACHLIVMAGDPRKDEIAEGQSYFSMKTREAEVVIPAQSARLAELEAENKNMELKLKVYEAQQKTLASAGLLAMTAPAIAEAIILPGVTVIEKVEHIDRTILVDTAGKVVSQFDGIGITAIQKQFGFKTTKAAWAWLESIGYGANSEYWREEPTALKTKKLDRSVMPEIKQKFAKKSGGRQRLIGE